jgi:hypothetical protein
MLLIFLFFLQCVAAFDVTVSDVPSSTVVAAADASFQVVVRSAGQSQLTLTPGVDALSAGDVRAAVVTSDAATRGGVCIGIFVGSASSAGLAGCLGDPAACNAADESTLWGCTISSRLAVPLPAHDPLSLVVTAAPRAHWKPVALSVTFPKSCVSGGVHTLGARGDMKVVGSATASCASVAAMDSLHMGATHARSAITATLSVHMLPPPSFSVAVAVLGVHPLPANAKVYAIASVSLGARTPGQRLELGTSGVFPLQHCTSAHTIDVDVFGIDGTLIVFHTETFSPVAACVAAGLAADCHCGGDAKKRRRSESPPRVTVALASDETPGEVTLTSSAACVAVDATSGTETVGTATDGACAMSLDVGTYIVLSSSAGGATTLQSIMALESFTSVDVVVCRADLFSAEFVTDPAPILYAPSPVFCPNRVVPITPTVRWTHNGQSIAGDAVWFPAPGLYAADISACGPHEQCVSGSAEFTVAPQETDHVPVYCTDAAATIESVHMPLTDDDHTAAATVRVRGNIDNARLAVQVRTNGKAGPWMHIGHEYTHRLVSRSSYSFKVMRVQQMPDAAAAVSACYINAGHVEATPSVSASLQNPIQIVVGDMGRELLLFRVAIKGTTGAVIQSVVTQRGDTVDIVAVTEGSILMAVGPLSDWRAPYANSSMLLSLVLDTGMHLDISDLDYVLSKGLYPTPVAISNLEVVSLDRGGEDLDCSEAPQRLAVSWVNPTWLDIAVAPHPLISVAGSRRVGDVQTLDLVQGGVPLGDPVETGIFVGVNPLRSEAIRRTLPATRLVHPARAYVPSNLRATVVPLSNATTHDDAILCEGKRLFTVQIPGGRHSPVKYRTSNDPDVGSVPVVDGTVLAITVGRATPLALLAYFMPSTGTGMGRLLRCRPAVPASEFANTWHMPVPTLRDVSRGLSRTLNLALDARGAEGISVEMFSESGIPVVFRFGGETLWAPDLSPGMYSTTVSWTGAFGLAREGTTCARTWHFLATDDADTAIDAVDLSRTTAGVQRLQCPRNLYGDTHVWAQYFVITLAPGMADKLTKAGITTTVSLWKNDGGQDAPAALWIGPSGSFKYRMHDPGSYVPQITLEGKTETLTSRLPDVSFADPLFTVESFALEVISYPSCIELADGAINIVHPVNTTITVSFVRCIPLSPLITPGDCLRGVQIDSSNGGTRVSGVPFATEMLFALEIGSACKLDAPYVFLPTATMHPQVTGLRYLPSCDDRHRVVALQDKVPIAEGFGRIFSWTLTDGVETYTSNDAILSFEARHWAGRRPRASVTLTYGVCSTGEGISITLNISLPPSIRIDAVGLPKSESQPIFCPGEDDAVLTATLNPPLRPPHLQVEWIKRGVGKVKGANAVSPARSMVTGLGAGIYEARYSVNMGGGLVCTATDVAHVQPKQDYMVRAHMRYVLPTCPGGTGSAELDDSEHNEISAFTADMLTSPDRRYLRAGVSGSKRLVDIPDGHVILARMPRSPLHPVATDSPFCSRHLVVSAGALSPPVVLSGSAGVGGPVGLYVPPWHTAGHVDAAGTVLHGDGCQHALTLPNADAPSETLVIDPVQQTLVCPETASAPVSVYALSAATGVRTLRQTLSPDSDARALADIDSHFHVTRAEPPMLLPPVLLDPECNLSPLMRVRVTVSEPRGALLLFQDARVDGAPVKCIRDSLYVTICSIPRTRSHELVIPYSSSLNGTCALRISVYPLVLEAATYHPAVSKGCLVGHVTACVASLDAKTLTSMEGDRCMMNHTVAPARGQEIGLNEPPVQIVVPSCQGASDGAIVWLLHPDNTAVVEIDGVAVKRNVTRKQWAKQTTFVQTGLAAGLHTIVSTGPDGVRWRLSATVPAQDDMYVIVQPALYLPPAPWYGGVLVTGLPRASVGPVDVIAYIHGGSETARIRIGNSTGTVRANNDLFWTHTATLQVDPGGVHEVEVACGDGKQTRRRHAASVYMESARAMKVSAKQTNGGHRVEVDIDGGVAPFMVIAGGAVIKGSARHVVLADPPDVIQVVDAQGTVIDTRVAEYGVQLAFESVRIVASSGGCGDGITTEVQASFEAKVLPRALWMGAWLVGDNPIASCDDDRLQPPHTAPGSFVIHGYGRWRVAACDHDSKAKHFAVYGGADIDIPQRVTTWTAAAVAAGVASTSPATIRLSVDTEDKVGLEDYNSGAIIDFERRGADVFVYNAWPGVLHVSIYSMVTRCPQKVTLDFAPAPVQHALPHARRADPATPSASAIPLVGAFSGSASDSPEHTRSASPTPEQEHSNGSTGMSRIALTLVMVITSAVSVMIFLIYATWRPYRRL